MKEYVFSYYPEFRCVAQRCKHTCCADWDMCIDEKTLSDYKNDKSTFSKKLCRGVNFKKSMFRSDKSGRCAFLNGEGLCEIIINLGEGALCQVCRDHPRFRSFFDDRVEMGLGFCCEEATRIILSYNDKIVPVLTFDDKKQEQASFIQELVLKFRQKALEAVQRRDENINDRINELLALCNAEIAEQDFKKVLKTFLSFERLGNSWGNRLKSLKKKSFSSKTDESLSLCCEQFLVNSIYRHLSDAEDTMWVRARTLACVFSWWIIKGVFESELPSKDDFELVCDVVRDYSAEVEYSQKNLDKLFNFAYKFIKL